MHIYIAKRLLQAIPVIFLVTVITFSLIHLMPGDPAIMRAGEGASIEQVEAIREAMGLNEPIHQQYLSWVTGLLQGDLGYSLQDGRPVFSTLIQRLPATLYLVMASFVVSIAIGVPIGILSAVKQNTFIDSFARGFALLGISLPSFWFALMMMLLFSYKLQWLPASGSGTLAHLIMPSLALGMASAGLITRMTRSAMLEVLKQDYIRTARSKGLRAQIVIYKHALKNALLPVVTVIGLQLGYRLGGSVIVETVFAYPGIGRFAYNRLLARDFPMIMGNLFIFAMIFIIVNIITDIIYGFLEPRIRYD
ncbi:binding-protein-dependent transport systems inner membrane component [Alkaliphilus metalliredigens QYMF]|uniref:Nickel import system permease protein NikB n=1 Tax=Alkaliphilus metalliredigens (strain QYMF) TaxID=293826 RepID=A6TPV5_ALKMQ|nr:nickel ABC transporter permease [Alkaliphilus metalliredigens]ABR48223.1 binding-protein-dependent transport systems inner membrane component [Alkaliphilus metalliredigens QYMF]